MPIKKISKVSMKNKMSGGAITILVAVAAVLLVAAGAVGIYFSTKPKPKGEDNVVTTTPFVPTTTPLAATTTVAPTTTPFVPPPYIEIFKDGVNGVAIPDNVEFNDGDKITVKFNNLVPGKQLLHVRDWYWNGVDHGQQAYIAGEDDLILRGFCLLSHGLTEHGLFAPVDIKIKSIDMTLHGAGSGPGTGFTVRKRIFSVHNIINTNYTDKNIPKCGVKDEMSLPDIYNILGASTAEYANLPNITSRTIYINK